MIQKFSANKLGSPDLYTPKSPRRGISKNVITVRESTRSKHNVPEPKIVLVTIPVEEEGEMGKGPTPSPERSSRRSLSWTPKKKTLRKHISEIFKRGPSQKFESSFTATPRNFIEDPLKRKSRHTSSKYRSSRNESGRLLTIMAKQAINGKNLEVSKIFFTALVI